jgi:hypothetical protein
LSRRPRQVASRIPLLDRPELYLGRSSSLVPRPAAIPALAFSMRRRNSG